jgi:hypothetical protein
MKKIKLYHYSNADIKNKISVRYFADNSYTGNDYNISKVNRAFYYLNTDKKEYRFDGCKYLYIIEVNPTKLYDIKTDVKGYLKKYSSIHETLTHIKRHYIGVVYNIGISDIAVIFLDLQIKEKITRI